MRPSSTLRALSLGAALLVACACSSDSTGPAPDRHGSIVVTPSANDVFEGDKLSLHAVVRDASGREVPNASVTWSSADETIALVSSAGEVTALRSGVAHISARSGDLTASLAITIRQLTVLQVSLVGLPDEIGSGDIVVFSVQAQGAGGRDVHGRQVTLASTDPAVALIDPSGRVRAVAAGTATISATVDGVVGTARVVVTSAPAELALRLFDGTRPPTLISGGYFDRNGVVEYDELYLETGRLQLTGGAQPRYQTVVHYALYNVTFDGAGQRHFVLRSVADIRDQGSVRYDERGDPVLTSELTSDPVIDLSAETGGFTLRNHYADINHTVTSLFFRREPK